MPDRAQTETLGFVLVFALITASIGLVYASGFTGLNEAREFEQVNNAERAFEVLADNMEDITHRNAPSRSTEIKLAEAVLHVADPVEIEVNDPDSPFNATYEVQPVVYEATDTGTQLVYAQGAVMRVQDGGFGRVVAEGTLVLDENRTVVPVIQTRLAGRGLQAGSATILLRADLAQTRLVYANDTADNTLWVNVTSPRAGIWRDHLVERYDDVTCSLAGDTVSCRVVTDQVYVVLYQIDLSIE